MTHHTEAEMREALAETAGRLNNCETYETILADAIAEVLELRAKEAAALRAFHDLKYNVLPETRKPICSVCNETHMGCQKCMGEAPYCATTPCDCACHR